MWKSRGGRGGGQGGKCFKQVGGGRGSEARGRVKGERNVQGNRMGKWESGKVCHRVRESRGRNAEDIRDKKKKKMNSESTLGMLTH